VINEKSPGFGFLNSRPMIAIGALSYSIYVWHFLFLSSYMDYHFAMWPTHDWKLWLIPTMALSTVSYYFLELPFMNLRRKLHY